MLRENLNVLKTLEINRSLSFILATCVPGDSDPPWVTFTKLFK